MSYSIRNNNITNQSNKEMLWEILREKAKEDLQYDIDQIRDFQLFFNNALYRIHDDRYSFAGGIKEMNKIMISECYNYILNLHQRQISMQIRRNNSLKKQKAKIASKNPTRFQINQETSSTIQNNTPVSISTRKQKPLHLSRQVYESRILERKNPLEKPPVIDFSISMDETLPNVDKLMEDNMKKRDHELEMITRGYATPVKKSQWKRKEKKNQKKKEYSDDGIKKLTIDSDRKIDITSDTKPLKSMIKQNKQIESKTVQFSLNKKNEDSININGLINKLKPKNENAAMSPLSESKNKGNQDIDMGKKIGIDKTEQLFSEINLVKKDYGDMKQNVDEIKNNINDIFDILKKLQKGINDTIEFDSK